MPFFTVLALAAGLNSPQAALECGVGRAEIPAAVVSVWVEPGTDETLKINRVTVLSRNPERTFGLVVEFRTSGPGLSSPYALSGWAYMPLAERTRTPETTQWKLPGGEWSGPDRYVFPLQWEHPDRAHTALSFSRRGANDVAPELLDRLPQGLTLEMRRLSRDGRVLGEGEVTLPPLETLEGLYTEARQAAEARRAECGRRVMIMPAPR